MKLIIILLATAGLLMAPASALATRSTHSADKAARQKFDKVSGDRWAHSKTQCMTRNAPKRYVYWHCHTHVDGHAGKHGDFNVLVNRETLKAYIRGFTITT